MGKVTSTRHTINKYNAFGANVGGGGWFAIMCTLTGSCNEKIHRIVGNSYKDIEKCINRALKYHEQGRQNVEILHMQSERRITIHELLAIQRNLNKSIH